MNVTVNRKGHFNAAHRLHNPNWDAAENKRVFGKCNNPDFHGHNYEYIVSVTGPVNPDTGFVVDMKWLADLMIAEIEDRFDHKNLNTQTSEFANKNPTAENIAIAIYNILRPHMANNNSLKITVYETPRNFVEFAG